MGNRGRPTGTLYPHVCMCEYMSMYEFVYCYTGSNQTHTKLAAIPPLLNIHMICNLLLDLIRQYWVKKLRKSSCFTGLTQFDQDPALNLVEAPLLILKATPMSLRSRQHMQPFL